MTPLGERLIRRIADDGPITVAEYMSVCLHDPEHGYYATRPALGEAGDFITAPLVSQMFGEVIGLWAVEIWRRLGAPDRFVLAEFGPGDGTMMADMLRAARLAPGFLAAAEVWLVETSAPLRAKQAETLGAQGLRWAVSLPELPVDPPLIAVGNEFLDCLPVEQAVMTPDGWRERRVGVREGRLVFVADAPVDGPVETVRGAVRETAPELRPFGAALGARLTTGGGAALFIDYGGEAGSGDTLQAVRGHAKEHPLASPGAADLTSHVDFAAFLAGARETGAAVAPLETQAGFLTRLGFSERAKVLRRARPDRARSIDRQVERLTGAGQMGERFKAAVLHSPGLAPP